MRSSSARFIILMRAISVHFLGQSGPRSAHAAIRLDKANPVAERLARWMQLDWNRPTANHPAGIKVWQVTESSPQALKRLKSLQIHKPPPVLKVA
jgi:hypothetical protein